MLKWEVKTIPQSDSFICYDEDGKIVGTVRHSSPYYSAANRYNGELGVFRTQIDAQNAVESHAKNRNICKCRG